jgi:hypothetical protein
MSQEVPPMTENQATIFLFLTAAQVLVLFLLCFVIKVWLQRIYNRLDRIPKPNRPA